MNSIVDAVHAAVHAIVALLLKPFSGMNPVWGLSIVSVVLGVLLVLAYGKLSSQSAIRKVKSDIYRALLESVLFRHDLKLSLRAQGEMVLRALKYFALAIPPLVILAVPCVFFLAQLAQWYEDRPLKIGEPGIVKVELKTAADVSAIKVVAPDALSIASVRVPADKELVLRVTPQQPGRHEVVLSLGGQEYKVPVVSGDYSGPLFLGSYGDFWRRVLTPDGPIGGAAAALAAIEIQYPARDLVVAGINVSWIVLFFIVSLIAGLIGSKIFGVAV